ncbi:hypothetical protein [Rhodospirillum rubrum]|uniref:Uncharacterized protein n=1 Tax=Rhodospirillum rubrum (strain ATCC 11170 / ATH 1.1.1 / DSM 467 / LMG 4362 / NCIMB 8255 / S1) TaxID=269796 RepID=Q2RU96_RHORT|nr:hypothetical protein [Rhodospirillum rubrum]ABC22299.1 hypothetical protein Rru_A1498 [Rhodospirillum rubrum ATCC 11170]AEO48017.1 hypothetical protein F11_07735 [Rhodospirillum rubrum F11]MBK5953867.1 hypothetical protein [Rhodospirillum rubrum]QXG81940.1 hypothetical protein KUL73_07760 [Rhodospirillum rubrum]HAP98442.1 hypothetical protein [Rhodospirillum rubrum]
MKPITILVVEDDPQSGVLVAAVLESMIPEGDLFDRRKTPRVPPGAWARVDVMIADPFFPLPPLRPPPESSKDTPVLEIRGAMGRRSR